MAGRKIAFGGDHAGYLYKKDLMEYCESLGFETQNFGADTEDSVDYPDYTHPLSEAVSNGECELGVLICGSGNGVCMTANKHKGIRAALCWNTELGELARQHNNANVLCIPARFISLDEAKAILKVFLETPFEGGRHERRVNKIADC